MDRTTQKCPRTIHDEISFLRNRLAVVVRTFNDDESWDAALRAQAALVAVHHIFGADDADFERGYEL
jgi:hypothetical protein